MKFKSTAKKPRLEETSRPTVEPLSDRDAPEAPEVPVERRNIEGIEPEVTRSGSSFQRFRNTTHENRFEALHKNKLLVTREVKIESILPFEEIHARLVQIFEAMEWTKLASI